ncbi:hypothetical protein EYF80_062245 [Liparis tanakae]|uniref:Uncharacterized protein n=1 Tax=Liparis tanakae TaxID=230148 RepID=A0A4Z2EFD9_9TELE|nr:hypothetical protein EYF80_062245 [Liparis tanakae]
MISVSSEADQGVSDDIIRALVEVSRWRTSDVAPHWTERSHEGDPSPGHFNQTSSLTGTRSVHRPFNQTSSITGTRSVHRPFNQTSSITGTRSVHRPFNQTSSLRLHGPC